MSAFVLIRADAASTLLRDDPFVRAADVSMIRDADGLLAAAKILRDDARRASEAAAGAARDRGYEDGCREGLAAAAGEIQAELLRLAKADDERAERQRADLARLGLEVVRRIAGEIGAAETVAALADRAAAAVVPDAQLTVRVPPAALAATRERFGARAQVEPDETLGETDCVLATPLGEVRAGLDTQLTQLARQWGLE